MKRSVVSLAVVLALGLSAEMARADQCLEGARKATNHLKSGCFAYYWSGAGQPAVLKTGDSGATCFVYYLPTPELAGQLPGALPQGTRPPGGASAGDAQGVANPPAHCAGLSLRGFEVGEPRAGEDHPEEKTYEITDVAGIVGAYRGMAVGGRSPLVANAAVSTIGAEAAQILGQIVVDRASQAAYSLLSTKVRDWLDCEDGHRFDRTCQVLKDLRLQDLAMAPSVLEGALAADVLAFKGGWTSSGNDPAALALAYRVVRDAVLPALSRRAGAITGRDVEAAVVGFVNEGLRSLGQGAKKKLCSLPARQQVLATAATAFAACRVSGARDCPIGQMVGNLDATCPEGSGLSDGQLAMAASLAGHLEDAVTLSRSDRSADGVGRLAAAARASFEVACMYTFDDRAEEYECKIDESKHGDVGAMAVTPHEKIAIVRDAVLAAIDRDGQTLATAVVRALVRIVPAAEDSDVKARKGLRVLATLTAYAATYTEGDDSNSKDAHEQRTKLLESLTRDMSDRTERGGDWVFSLGGSLRGVAGARVGHHPDRTSDRMTAFWGPLSLPLGFGLDYLQERHRGGLHVEFSVLDLGQYLSWDQGGQVATPDLTDAFAPALTLAWYWGRETPMFVGVTGGYSPGFDFDRTDDELRGSWNVAATLGVYIPLLDLN